MFDDPKLDPLNKANVGIQSICWVFTICFFLMRCFVRLGGCVTEREWKLEDWIVSLSMVGLFLYSILLTLMISNKGGMNEWLLSKDETTEASFYFWIGTIFYGLTVLASRISILLTMDRLLIPMPRPHLQKYVRFIMALIAIFYVIVSFVILFSCRPIQKAYRSDIPGTCLDRSHILTITGSFNILSDFLTIVVPAIACWEIQITRIKKIVAFLVVTLGFLPLIVDIGGAISRAKSVDGVHPIENKFRVGLWSLGEITILIWWACFPVVTSILNLMKTTIPPTNASNSIPLRRMGLFQESGLVTDHEEERALIHSTRSQRRVVSITESTVIAEASEAEWEKWSRQYLGNARNW